MSADQEERAAGVGSTWRLANGKCVDCACAQGAVLYVTGDPPSKEGADLYIVEVPGGGFFALCEGTREIARSEHPQPLRQYAAANLARLE